MDYKGSLERQVDPIGPIVRIMSAGRQARVSGTPKRATRLLLEKAGVFEQPIARTSCSSSSQKRDREVKESSWESGLYVSRESIISSILPPLRTYYPVFRP